MLALPAPAPIAGLLPARVPSSESPKQAAPAPFIFDRPVLADLSTAQRERLYDATNVLLEIAVEFMVGTFNEDAIRAAEVVFHRAVGGKSVVRPLSPQAFNAEIDADWLEMLARQTRSSDYLCGCDRNGATSAGAAPRRFTMNDEQEVILRGLMVGLDMRYAQMNAKLLDAVARLERLRSAIDATDPLGDELDEALQMLIRAAQDGTTLQYEVTDTVRRQARQSRSAKVAYEQGWAARAIDVLAKATPAQAAVLYALLNELNVDESGEVPF